MSSRLRERAGAPVEVRGELALYRLGRATEIRCARCAARQVTRWLAVLREDWTSLWCKSCFAAMPAGPRADGRPQGPASAEPGDA
jgi:hypothetical protein